MSASDEAGSPIALDMAREVVRLSELYLDGMLKLDLAANARAMQVAALSATSATALVLFGFSYVAHSAVNDIAIGWAAFAAGAAFLSALYLSLWSARPREFNISGNLLSSWTEQELRADLAPALMSQAEGYVIKINENMIILSTEAKRINRALRIIAAAPPLAVAAWLIRSVVG